MNSLIATMLRVRGFQAVMLAALAALAFGAAIALPAFIQAADASVITTESSHASVDEQLIEATRAYSGQGPWDRPDSTFESAVPDSLAQPSFSIVYADETDALVTGPILAAPRLQFRQGVCGHVVLAAGRCPVGTNEVMISASLATKESMTAGSVISLVFAKISYGGVDGPGIMAAPGFDAVTFNVVGVYRPVDTSSPYWGDDQLFTLDGVRGADAPIFAAPGVLGVLGHGTENEYVNAVLNLSALRADQIGTVRTEFAHAAAAAATASPSTGSKIPALLTAIDDDVASVHETVILVALPLIGLGWVVVFLASAYAVSGRREEIGIVKMRGVRYSRRVWLGTGEATIAVIAAIPLGYLIAALAMRPVVRHLLPGHPSMPSIGAGAAPYVLVTFVGCLVAIIAAAYRTLGSPTTDLLRDVPPRTSKWRSAAFELMVVVFAAASLEQFLTERSRLTGIDLVAPWFAIAALGVLSARILVPIVGLIGRRGLARGRSLGRGIGALQVARRPGATRVFVLIVIAFGLVTYAAAATSVAAAARSDRARLSLGADTVVTVGPVTRFGLLDAVRKADPSGRSAMAVATIPQQSLGSPAVLGVDSDRLSAVAAWPSVGISAAKVTSLLAPRGNAPIIMHGGIMAVDMQIVESAPGAFHPFMELSVQPLDGEPISSVTFYQPDPTKPEWDADAGACRKSGCRIAGLSLHDDDYFGGRLTVTLSAPRIVDPVMAPFAAFTAAGLWRVLPSFDPQGTQATVTTSAGLLTIAGSSSSSGFAAHLEPVDAAYPAPAIATGQIGVTTVGALGQSRMSVPVMQVGRVVELPGLPANAVLVDLQDADRIVAAPQDIATDPEVWLSASAPEDMLSRLRSAGLTITSVTHDGPVSTYLDGQGPAVGSVFYVLTTVGGILLAVGATILIASVDRVRRGRELQALRVQGLPMRSVASASLFTHVGLTVMAVVGGLVAGLSVWRLTGAQVPIFADGHTVNGVSIWPAWSGLVTPLTAAAALLIVVSATAAWDLRRFVRRGDLNSGTGR